MGLSLNTEEYNCFFGCCYMFPGLRQEINNSKYETIKSTDVTRHDKCITVTASSCTGRLETAWIGWHLVAPCCLLVRSASLSLVTGVQAQVCKGV